MIPDKLKKRVSQSQFTLTLRLTGCAVKDPRVPRRAPRLKRDRRVNASGSPGFFKFGCKNGRTPRRCSSLLCHRRGIGYNAAALIRSPYQHVSTPKPSPGDILRSTRARRISVASTEEKRMKIQFVNPHNDSNMYAAPKFFRHASRVSNSMNFQATGALFPPLNLATLAALTPPEHEVA